MYICEDCGSVFDEPKIVYERHPYGMGYATEAFGICPHCKSSNFDTAKRCSRCDEYVAELHDELCDICYEDMYGE